MTESDLRLIPPSLILIPDIPVIDSLISLRYPEYPVGPGTLISGTPDTPSLILIPQWYSPMLPDTP
jgi:hypothetical protein